MLKNKQQLLLLAASILGVVILFFGTNITRTKQKGVANRDIASSDSSSNSSNVNWTTVETLAMATLSGKDSTLLNQINQSNDINKIISFWESKNNVLMAANVAQNASRLQPNNDSLANIAGLVLLNATKTAQEEQHSFLYKEATAFFEKAKSIDSTKIIYTVNLAKSIVNSGDQPPMEGIKLLLDVVRNDSTQLEANLELVRFAMVSGQLDKAQIRLENLKRMYKNNFNVVLLQTKLYFASNKTNEAQEYLKMCFDLAKNNEQKQLIKNEFQLQ